MTMWIALGLVVVGLVVLVVLAVEIRGHLKRLARTLADVQSSTAPKIAALEPLLAIEMPHRTLRANAQQSDTSRMPKHSVDSKSRRTEEST